MSLGDLWRTFNISLSKCSEYDLDILSVHAIALIHAIALNCFNYLPLAKQVDEVQP